jgi:predicted flap endonuclease-1-like 5' DNA nuclease
MQMLQDNWPIVAAVGALLIMLALWIILRRRAAPDEVAADARPAAPLQPNRPDIIPAQPARFAAAEARSVPETASEPAPVPSPAPPPPASDLPADNLTQIKGLGPKIAAILAGLGITRFAQIASWTDADIAAIDVQLGVFQGRITKDNWRDQAGYLAKGDTAGFEAKYGALGGSN